MAGTDYGDGLRSTMDAARRQILDLGQSAMARRQQAVLTLGHAEQALSVAENTLARAQADLKTAYSISRMAVQGGALIQSADQLATLARTASDNANSALSVATTSIKTLASAFDTLTGRIAAVEAIASNDDFGSTMARSAVKARGATLAADQAVDQLKAAALSASIQSAQSMAASVATSVTTVGGELQGLVDRAAALLSAAQQRVGANVKQRAAAAQAERAALTEYHQAKIDSEALDNGTTNMDVALNGNLTVTLAASASTSTSGAGAPAASPGAPLAPPGAPAAPPRAPSTPSGAPPAPSLHVKYTIPGASTDRCYFFALPESDAAGFSYNEAKTAVIDTLMQGSDPGWVATEWLPTEGVQGPDDRGQAAGAAKLSLRTYTANIRNIHSLPPRRGDSSGSPKFETIKSGQSYRVFGYRIPLEGPYATNAADLSYPSRAVKVMDRIPDGEKYTVAISIPPTDSQPSSNASTALFSVQVTAPENASDVAECRAFVLLEDVYRAVKDDASLLAGGASAASYKVLKAASSKYSCSWSDGETDAYGDIILRDVSYTLLILLVPVAAETMASELLNKKRIKRFKIPALSTPPPPQTVKDANRGAETAAPSAGQPSPGKGTK